jgi:hypothetical protein
MQDYNSNVSGNGGEEKKLDRVPLNPTLIIGLGGSGKEVILRLRRLFYEKYGHVKMPAVEYMWFDTDKNDLVSKDRDIIDAIVQLEESDIIDATMEKGVCDEVLSGLEQNYSHIEKWYKKDALQNSLVTGLTDGAKQIRPLGRLATFYRAESLKKKIREKIDNLRRNIEASKKFYENRGMVDYKIDGQKINLFICGSLAGGTGSGSFLDVGFISRLVGKEHFSGTHISNTGIFFLPSVFEKALINIDGAMPRANANGYGALMELNYYLFPHIKSKREKEKDNHLFKFKVQYNAGGAEKEVDQPYDLVYLVDGENEDGSLPHEHTDTFQMVSEFLFLDFCESTFTNTIRSLHSNALPALSTEQKIECKLDSGAKYQEYYPNRFSVLGLSQIRMNVDRVRRAASVKLQKDILKLLVRENTTQPGWFDEDKFISYKLTASEIDKESQKRDEKESFEEYYKKIWDSPFKKRDGGSVGEFPGMEKMKSDILKLKEEATTKNLETNISDMIKSMNSSLRNVLDSFQTDCAEGFTNGTITLTVEENKKRLQKTILKTLNEEFLKDLYNVEHLGVSYAKERINRISNQIKKLIQHYESIENVESFKPELMHESLEGIQKASIDNKEIEMLRGLKREADSLIPLMPPLFKSIAVNYFSDRLISAEEHATGLKKRSEKEYVKGMYEELLNVIREKEKDLLSYIKDELNKRSAKEVRGVLNFVLQHVENEWGRKINLYLNTINNAVVSYENEFKAFNSPVPSKRNIELSSGWDESVYEEEIARVEEGGVNYQRIVRDNLLSFYDSFAKKFKKGSINEVVEDIVERAQKSETNSAVWTDVLSELKAHSHQFLKNFNPQSISSSAEHFYKMESDPSKRKEILESCLKSSKPWFQPSSRFKTDYSQLLAGQGEGRISIRLIGTKNRNIINDLSSKVEGGSLYSFKEFTEESILFFTEYIGIALFAFNNLNHMRDAYLLAKRRNPEDIYKHHLEKDFDKYPEIIPPDSNEVSKMGKVMTPFLSSLILGLVTYNSEREKFYRTGRGDTGEITNTPLRSTIVSSTQVLSEKDVAAINIKTGSIIDKFDVEKLYQMAVLMQKFFIEDSDDIEKSGVEKTDMLAFYARRIWNEMIIRLWKALGVENAEGLIEAPYEEKVRNEKVKEFYKKYDDYKANVANFSEKVGYSDRYIQDGYHRFSKNMIDLDI